jgi:hypothetical protein
MPYFAYVSLLHLYETLGWWRRSAGMKRVHFEEECNEFHHLLIVESLGGDQVTPPRKLRPRGGPWRVGWGPMGREA